MTQARRRQSKKIKKPRHTAGSGLGMLITGIVIGCVVTTLFLGWKKDPQHGFGSGINQMIEKSRQARSNQAGAKEILPESKPQKSPNYNFYTILPEIEQVIPEEYIPPKVPKQAATVNQSTNQAADQLTKPDHYILQAGSFLKREDADQLKAQLALSGYESYIQKVTVDGKKYYRLRMGPYRNLYKLDKARNDLSTRGINAIRIKVSKN